MNMPNAAEMRALLVTIDPSMVATFTDALRGFAIAAETSAQTEGVPTELRQAKYEALVLDFDTIRGTQPILSNVRGSPSNKHAVVFAVATGALRKKTAHEQGANFVFERPFAPKEINQVLGRAYGLMTRERRRYFRCTAELPILIRCGSETALQCMTINISSNGMAVHGASSFDLGRQVQIAFRLHDSEPGISAAGTVVWDDRHGKTGINFQCTTAEMQSQLDSWLDTKFSEQLSVQRGSV